MRFRLAASRIAPKSPPIAVYATLELNSITKRPCFVVELRNRRVLSDASCETDFELFAMLMEKEWSYFIAFIIAKFVFLYWFHNYRQTIYDSWKFEENNYNHNYN